MYEVVLSHEAQRIYASAEPALANKIARCLEQLQQTPRTHPNIKALKGRLAGYYAIALVTTALFTRSMMKQGEYL